jgi:peptidoglycan/xylan/chitin deacetylase (PgdA/CDA1 family)
VQLLLSKFKVAIQGVIVSLAKLGGGARLFARLADGYQKKKDATGHRAFPFIKKRRVRTCQILAYHRVNDENDYYFPAIPTSLFARQMEILAERFTLCSLERLLEGIQTGDMPENAVAVTFDDGYRDNYQNAFPVLKRHSIPATIFLATGVIGTSLVLWHDRVFAAFRKTQAPCLAGLDSRIGRLPLGSLTEKLAAQKQVLNLLWSMDAHERELAIQRLTEGLEVDGDKEINGIDFGAHTVTHPILSRLSREAAAREINDSLNTIEKKLGSRVKSFAYPVGRAMDFDATTKALLEDAGCRCAVTMIFGSNESGADPYELRRIIPWAENADLFALRLSYFRFCS